MPQCVWSVAWRRAGVLQPAGDGVDAAVGREGRAQQRESKTSPRGHRDSARGHLFELESRYVLVVRFQVLSDATRGLADHDKHVEDVTC